MAETSGADPATETGPREGGEGAGSAPRFIQEVDLLTIVNEWLTEYWPHGVIERDPPHGSHLGFVFCKCVTLHNNQDDRKRWDWGRKRWHGVFVNPPALIRVERDRLVFIDQKNGWFPLEHRDKNVRALMAHDQALFTKLSQLLDQYHVEMSACWVIWKSQQQERGE